MSETGGYQPPEAAEQRSIPQADTTAFRQRMIEIQREREEHGTPYPPEFFYLSTRYNLVMHSELLHGAAEPITPVSINRELERTYDEVRYVTDKRFPQGVNGLRLAFLAHALPRNHELSEDQTLIHSLPEQLKQMQQTEEPVNEIILDAQQAQTLTWMLDSVAIPHGALEAGTQVPLTPLQEAIPANGGTT